MAKCKAGKGCGSSCISVPYLCQMEISSSDAEKIDKMADLLINRDAAIKTPQQAANWLERNKEAIALSGGGSSGGNDGDVMVVALEPGIGRKDYHEGGDINNPLKHRYEGTIQDKSKDINNDEWNDRNPVAVTNLAKTQLELNTLMVGRGEIGRLNARSELSELKIRPEVKDKLIKEIEQGRKVETYVKGSPYVTNTRKMLGGTGLETMTNVNPSPIGLPSLRSWPFKNLPLEKGSVFSTRDSWHKYLEPKLSKQLSSQLSRGSSKAVYLAGSKKGGIHERLFKRMAKESGATIQSSPIRGTTGSGRAKTIKFDYFFTPDGKLVFQAPHPSFTGWSNSDLAQMNAQIKELLGN